MACARLLRALDRVMRRLPPPRGPAAVRWLLSACMGANDTSVLLEVMNAKLHFLQQYEFVQPLAAVTCRVTFLSIWLTRFSFFRGLASQGNANKVGRPLELADV